METYYIYEEDSYDDTNSDMYYFINYKGKKGWIIYDNEKLESIDVERKNCLIDENLEIEYEETKPSSSSNSNKNADSKLVLVTCIIVAIAISLTMLVTILTFNSKRKLKRIQHKNEVNEVQKNEER